MRVPSSYFKEASSWEGFASLVAASSFNSVFPSNHFNSFHFDHNDDDGDGDDVQSDLFCDF